MNKKLTAEDIMESEAGMLIDALGNCIELNDSFLESNCSKDFSELIKRIPERDREYIISGLSETHNWPGFPYNDNSDIWLNQDEIEIQFEGKPEDYFETPEDFTINGNLAYLYTGYGLSINFNREELISAINSYFEA